MVDSTAPSTVVLSSLSSGVPTSAAPYLSSTLAVRYRTAC